ncbi:MAG: SAM-dependent methyltransferase [Acidobacteria bacterium]|nr:MAG: SAM-dependent methyltransferase [Acidobacteriota bacterium]
MFTLDRVVPWGRSFDEYRRMFGLPDKDLALRIIGCGDGPASFNAEATRRGYQVVSCDPIYQFDNTQIEERIAATYEHVLEQTRRNAHDFVWGNGIRTVKELGAVRMAAMRTFLADYDAGKRAGRYVDAALPALPFEDGAFDLALCSHFPFLYSTQLGEAFHRAALHEMCRIATEVRVFPLLALESHRSPFVETCAADLVGFGREVAIERVPYAFQRGGNEMMRVRCRSAS